MRTVILTAASAFSLVVAAHAADARVARLLHRAHAIAAPTDLSQAPRGQATACRQTQWQTGASLSHASYTTDAADWRTASSSCPQYLSTQMLVQPPPPGHT
jgi:hypothetical protein